jgi:hypothetical protein
MIVSPYGADFTPRDGNVRFFACGNPGTQGADGTDRDPCSRRHRRRTATVLAGK